MLTPRVAGLLLTTGELVELGSRFRGWDDNLKVRNFCETDSPVDGYRVEALEDGTYSFIPMTSIVVIYYKSREVG